MFEKSIEEYSDLTLLMIIMNPDIYSEFDIERYQSELNRRNLNELENRSLIRNYEQTIKKSQDFVNIKSNNKELDSELLNDSIDKEIFQKYNSHISPKYKFSSIVSIWLTLGMLGQCFNIYDINQANFSSSLSIIAILISLSVIISCIFIFLKKKWAIYLLMVSFLLILVLGITLGAKNLILNGIIHLVISLVFFKHKVNGKYFWE
jgi:hypothetical protein